jgi:tetratricopeptide (TPR) repeat protein
MIETGLVYIYSTKPTRRFVGCGAVVESGSVATCRHVWHLATTAAEQPYEVEIEFPGLRQDGVTIKRNASLASSCVRSEGDPAPDLVLLLPQAIPDGAMTLQLAVEMRLETGKGYARTGLKGLNRSKPEQVQDVQIRGEIADASGFDGRRQFTGDNPQTYWFMAGSSGSPVFREGGQQLAGIVSLSELGEKHEAFVVSATTIRQYMMELAAKQTPASESIDTASLRSILKSIGALDVPVAEIPNRLKQFVEDAQARALEPVHPTNDGADIEAVIGASREKLRALDTVGAREVLQAKIAEEEEAGIRRRVALLRERAAVERLAFDYAAAKCTLGEITRLMPDDLWTWIKLGDLWLITGALDSAAEAYYGAEAAARRTGDERDLAVSYDRIGAVLIEKSDSAGALAAYWAARDISKALTERDPTNPLWQRDLWVARNKIGDVLRTQGNRVGALAAYRAGLAIIEKLVQRDPDNTDCQRDLAISHDLIGNVLATQVDRAGALDSSRAARTIREALAERDPTNPLWQGDLWISHNKIGHALMDQGNRAGALAAYRAGLAISKALTQRDPDNTDWQRHLAISHATIGDVLVAQGGHPDALAAFEAAGVLPRIVVQGARLATACVLYQGAHAIHKALTQCDPDNTLWQCDLLFSLMGSISLISPTEARPLLVRALDIARRLAAAGQLPSSIPDDLARRLAELRENMIRGLMVPKLVPKRTNSGPS